MVTFTSFIDQSGGQHCSYCGYRIRLLRDPQSLSLFLGMKSIQRRASRCMNCGQILCSYCARDSFRCTCGCNAWVALPYIEDSMVDAAEHQFA